MNELSIAELKKQLGSRKNWDLIADLHERLRGYSKRVSARIFPIYIRYSVDDDVVAMLFFRSSNSIKIEADEIELGIGFRDYVPRAVKADARHLKDANLTHSVRIRSADEIERIADDLRHIF